MCSQNIWKASCDGLISFENSHGTLNSRPGMEVTKSIKLPHILNAMQLQQQQIKSMLNSRSAFYLFQKPTLRFPLRDVNHPCTCVRFTAHLHFLVYVCTYRQEVWGKYISCESAVLTLAPCFIQAIRPSWKGSIYSTKNQDICFSSKNRSVHIFSSKKSAFLQKWCITCTN